MLIRFMLHIVPFSLLLLVCEKAPLCMLEIERGREYLPLSHMLYCVIHVIVVELKKQDVLLLHRQLIR